MGSRPFGDVERGNGIDWGKGETAAVRGSGDWARSDAGPDFLLPEGDA